MIISKKGIVFSMIAILMATLFIVLFSAYTHVPINEKMDAKRSGIERADNYFLNFKSFVQNSIHQSTYEILDYLVVKSGDGVNINFTRDFNSCIMDGKIESIAGPCSISGNNYTMENILNDISSRAAGMYKADSQVTVIDVNVWQETYYELTVNAIVNVKFSREDYWIWDKDFNITERVSLLGVKDPLMYRYDKNRTIANNGDSLASLSSIDGNETIFMEFINNGYSFVDSSAPSFIDLIEHRMVISAIDYPSLGYNSFIPPFWKNGTSTYIENRSFLTLDYVREKDFNKSTLRRIDGPFNFVNENLTYFLDDLIAMNFTNFLLVEGVCDENGCN